MSGEQEKMRAQPEQAMSYRRACEAIGKGDFQRGQQNLFMLAKRLEVEREKYPVFALGSYNELEMIGAEFQELARATAMESADSQRDKALDLLCGTMRLVNGEHRTKRHKRG